MKVVLFTGGGTGGHIYPGIAVAQEVSSLKKSSSESDYEVVWIGSSRGMDKTIVEEAGIKFYGIPAGKLRRYFSLKTITDMFRIIGGFFSSLHILRKIKPFVVFSKGGFVSVPPCFAAKLLKIPVVIHECDFTPGLANRINTRFASRILISYPETKKFFKEKDLDKVFVSGNPVRPVFYNGDKNKGLDFLKVSSISDYQNLPIVLVMGGSLGARQINSLIKEILPKILSRCIVVHQTGIANTDQSELTVDIPDSLRSRYITLAYIRSEMPHVLKAADIIISRSGANALWECAVQSKAMILIPFEGSGTRGDQVDNAYYFKQNKAAMVLSNNDENTKNKPTAENLKETLFALIDSKSDLLTLGKNLVPDYPAKKIANLLDELIKKK